MAKTKTQIRSYLTEHGIIKPKKIELYSSKGQEWLKAVYPWELVQLSLIDLLYDDLNHANKTKVSLLSIMSQDVLSDPVAAGLMTSMRN